MPIEVTVPNKGVLTFEDGTPESDISATIAKEFPRDGQDVASDVAQNPNFDRSMSVDDFKLYEKYMQERKTDLLSTAANAAGAVLGTIGNGIKGLFEARNLNPAVAAGTATESVAQGTRQMYGMLAQSEDPSSVLFRFKDWINGTGSAEDRLKQWQDAREFARRSQALDEGHDTVTGIPTEYVNNDVKNALSLVADPTMLIPGVGEALGASKLAGKVVGAGTKAAAEGVRLATRPLAGIIDAASEAALKASGPNMAAIKGAALGGGVTGLVMGVPGVREAAGVVGGVKLADKVAEIVSRAGETLAEGGSRIGPMEAIGMAPNAGKLDRALGVIGRAGGDTALDIGLAGATGALEGSAIGAGLGYLSGGEEGAAAGAGSGGVLGGAAGAGMRAFATATGKVAAENRAADFTRFLENADEGTRRGFEDIVKRDGIDAAVNTMDVRNLLEGHLKDAKFTVLDDAAFKERFGADARGVHVDTAGQPEVVINSSKMGSNYTAGHELFHALDSVEQLRPQAERIKQEIVGTFVTQPDGKVVQATRGLLSPAEVEARFDEYKAKAPANPEWDKATTPADKARLVANELGAEYMGRLISGSNPDEMLRGFSGPVRQLLDYALTRDANTRLRSLAESIGLGSKPVESLVFRDLQAASPALNGMLRDLVRARRNLSERMTLADEHGLVIQKKDINVPQVAEKALQMGVAQRNADGTVSMKPDDVLAKEDANATSALRNVVSTTAVSDTTKPHLRIVDDKIVGSGISPEQVAAIQASPGMSNKLKESLSAVANSINAQARPGDGNVLFIEYGAATKRVKNRLTGTWTSKYSSGIRLSQREVAPYHLYVTEAGNVVAKVVDMSKLRTDAKDLAARGRLGPYGADINGFLSDSVRYFDNISDPNGVRTRELPGMTPEKATYLNEHFGQDEKGGAKFIRDIRLDRVTEIRPTGERVAASELAWQRQKVRWMPSEKMPDGEVWQSKEGFRIVSKNDKFSLYSPDGQRVGIFDAQSKAEKRAALISDKYAGDEARNVPVDQSLPAGEQADVGKWISTRKPTAKGAHEDALKQNLVINSDSVVSDKEAASTVASMVKKYPGFKTSSTKPADVIADFKAFVVDNLLYLHDRMTPELRQRAQQWYDGARKITEAWSSQHGLSRETVAAVLASLSPQTDWFRNVSQAQRAIEIFKAHQDSVMSPKMESWLADYYGGDADADKVIDAIKGKAFKDLTTYEKAVWTRAFDQVNNSREYRILSPEGRFMDLVRNQDGSAASMGWGNFKTLSNAISVMENPSRANISERLGGEHKVRSFYNNILLPNLKAFGDVTIDTHAIAAALLRPLAGGDTEVAHNLGAGISSSTTGASGLYGIYADAYRTAAQMRGILPRQMQSITWEAIRGLFEKEFKTKANKELVNNVWNDYKKGKVSLNEARTKISDSAGGITTPDWARPDSGGVGQTQVAGNTDKLSAADAGQGASGTARSGSGNAASGSSEKVAGNFMPAAPDNTEYRGQHTAPGSHSAPAHDLTGNGVYPKDVYQRPDWYETDKGLSVLRKVLSWKGKPDERVSIYRAIPTEVYNREMAASEKAGDSFLSRVIRPGDWVTISKQYAREHGESALKGDFKVVAKHVPASHIFTNGDSIMEWGYHPNADKINFMPEAPSQAISSADTSLQQVPALFKSNAFVPRGTNLDIGAGKFDLGKQYLERERGVSESVPFDPFNRDAQTNRLAVERLQSGERFATTTIPNVLNVIAERSARDNVILQAARALDPKGVAYFQIYEGDRSGNGRETSKGYQNNKKTSDYLDEIRKHFQDVRSSGNVIVASSPKITDRKAFWQLSPQGPSLKFQPEAMPNGTVYREGNGYSVVNKTGAKFRVYSPLGALLGVANSLADAERMIRKRL